MTHDEPETVTLNANEALVVTAAAAFYELIATMPREDRRKAEAHWRAGGRFAVSVILPSENVTIQTLDEHGRPTTIGSTGPLVNNAAGTA